MQLVTNKAVETLHIPTTIVQCNHFTKKGDKAELNNYIPISVFTANSNYFLESNEMYCGGQFGFWEK